MPIARITWLGSSEPEVQAEPELAAMPNLLSSSRMASPSMNSNAMLLVLGRRLSGLPVTKERGTRAKMAASSLSRRRATSVFS
jgi:hypothetical protein